MNLVHRLQLHLFLFWAVVLGSILLSAMMVLPYIGAIISAYILAYFIRPVFLRLKPKYGNTVAAILCLIITTLLIVVPIGLVTLEVLNQLSDVSKGQGLANLIDVVVTQPLLQSLNVDTVKLKATIILGVNDFVDSTVLSIPSFIIGLVISLNAMFYLLCNWDNLSSHIKKYLPFKNNDKILTTLGATTDAIIHGHVLVSLLEGVIAFIGFYLLGVQASLIFAVLIFIFAFMPGIGTELIWGPLALYYLSIGQYNMMWGILVIGIILWIGIEFYFYTRFVGGRSKIHPFVLIIGVLGGLSVFGLFGFLLGPLVLVNSIKIIEEAIESNQVH